MHATPLHQNVHRHSSARARGFSLTELLVVIGIIILLVGILLVALSAVQRKARRTTTESRMQQFANACMAFQSEHGKYPGVIPEDVLRHHEDTNNECPISCTENALLHMMGGYRVLTPSDVSGTAAFADYQNFVNLDSTTVKQVDIDGPSGTWQLAFYTQKIGEGPIIDGKPYNSYFNPGRNDMASVAGQHGEPSAGFLPDLIDAWGQPIIYLRQARDRGPLLEDSTSGAPKAQFMTAGVDAYLHRTLGLGAEATVGGPGEMGQLQVFDSNNNTDGSMLTVGDDDDRNNSLAVVLSHPAFYKSSSPLYGKARGAFVLLSAGHDGVYYSAADGPGSDADPVDDQNGYTVSTLVNDGPKVVEEFNDIRVFGGG